jgi:DNA replication and repair protein RecF
LHPFYQELLTLNNISLTQFKNYSTRSFPFTERIVGICGQNGVGKTNLLDAIYYCCFTKSYFTRSDSQNILHNTNGFRIEGHFTLQGDPLKVVCILRETGRKEFSANDEPYEKLATHIGRLPCVIIAPDDVQIITGGSEERRRMLDALHCQLDPGYLQHLMDYNKVLQQRNGFLKSAADKRITDYKLLDVYDEQLCRYGAYVYNKRNEFLQSFLPLVASFYTQIAGQTEQLALSYESQLHDCSFPELLQRTRQKDIIVQRTSGGIHRDDINCQLNNQPFKALASQGQRKSLLFAMKLAEFDTLKQAKQFPPLLLLDDVFEKLDADRMHNLLDYVCVKNSGQVFITDTHPDRIRLHFDNLGLKYQLVSLEK